MVSPKDKKALFDLCNFVAQVAHDTNDRHLVTGLEREIATGFGTALNETPLESLMKLIGTDIYDRIDEELKRLEKNIQKKHNRKFKLVRDSYVENHVDEIPAKKDFMHIYALNLTVWISATDDNNYSNILENYGDDFLHCKIPFGYNIVSHKIETFDPFVDRKFNKANQKEFKKEFKQFFSDIEKMLDEYITNELKSMEQPKQVILGGKVHQEIIDALSDYGRMDLAERFKQKTKEVGRND